ncbi:MAG: hypothetical protein JWR16_3110 [Nevskia sp.]|nr:hypothetical protein [Nevskia sp.]
MPTRIIRIAIAVLRAALVAVLLFLCLRQWPAIALRGEMEALPDFNYLAAADGLRVQNRYAEALLVVETGFVNAPPEAQPALQAEHAQIESERDNLLRRVREVGYGALTGQGSSNEALAGAVAADLLVVGDVRDLAIQGARALRGEDTDEVIVALSAAGIALTLAPEVDWSVALLKFARRAGALTETFAKSLAKLARRAVSTRNSDALVQVGDDLAQLARSAKPAGAIGILRHIDDPETLHRAARFSGRPGGAFTLWIGEDSSVEWLKNADRSGEDWLLRAGRKGRAGIELLARNGSLLVRPHPLLGLLKGIYKGNVPAVLERIFAERADAIAGLVAGWLFYELGLLLAIVAADSRRKSRGLPA